MAEVVVKSAFVEEVVGSPVFVLKIAEPHSQKDDAGAWQTTSRTFFDVKAGYESGVDLARFGKGDRVTVAGRQKTVVREYEGKKFYTLTIMASSIDHVEGSSRSSDGMAGRSGMSGQGQTVTGGQNDGWANPGQSFNDLSAPF